MDALSLLRRAREAGLTLTVAGDKIRVHGPREAEPVVRLLAEHKPAVMAALAEATHWQARHREALAHWVALYRADEAAALAWGELQDRWHRLHGERVAPDLCAGCRKPIGIAAVLDMLDGCRVHLDTLDCLILHGERCRGTATRALAAMGLRPPEGAGR